MRLLQLPVLLFQPLSLLVLAVGGVMVMAALALHFIELSTFPLQRALKGEQLGSPVTAWPVLLLQESTSVSVKVHHWNLHSTSVLRSSCYIHVQCTLLCKHTIMCCQAADAVYGGTRLASALSYMLQRGHKEGQCRQDAHRWDRMV